MGSEYEIIIIGGGPAGLSAAMSIVRQHHKTLLFDSGKYRNGLSKHMHTVPTWDHRDPSEFRATARADFSRYGTITVEDAKVESAKKLDDGRFEVAANGKIWTAKKLILATGVEDVFPDIQGYAEAWVSGM
jgi:gliotoxin/aspirochlorine biosynthesis thioredoxin reductase